MLDANAALFRLSLFWGGLVFFLILELIRPYRRPIVSKLKRWIINLGMTAVNTVVLAAVFGTAILATAAYVTEHHLGALNAVAMPYWLKVVLAVLFLDFMIWVWHLLNHVAPLLWRFHRVHHCDLNMDGSTATRFHMGELAISAVLKIGLVYVIGADPLGVILFEALLVLCAQFVHSSFRISPALERLILPVLVPPSMHRVHHSVRIKERNTNYGTILSVWDRIMGTFLMEVDQAGIKIGVGGHYDASKQGLGRLLVMPFTRYVP